MAAIKAAEEPGWVTLVGKSDTVSGCTAGRPPVGYIPPIHEKMGYP
jgi:hypothetical protein